MSAFLFTNQGALDLAARERTVLNGGYELLLFKNDIAAVPGLTLADLVECDFSGYARMPIDLLLPYLDPITGGASCQQLAQWNFDGTAPTPVLNSVYGFGVVKPGVSPAPDTLEQVASFDAPVPMVQAGDSLPLTLLENYGAPPQ